MATIYYFTSTGNCLHMAKEIAEKIEADYVPMGRESVICMHARKMQSVGSIQRERSSIETPILQ